MTQVWNETQQLSPAIADHLLSAENVRAFWPGTTIPHCSNLRPLHRRGLREMQPNSASLH